MTRVFDKYFDLKDAVDYILDKDDSLTNISTFVHRGISAVFNPVHTHIKIHSHTYGTKLDWDNNEIYFSNATLRLDGTRPLEIHGIRLPLEILNEPLAEIYSFQLVCDIGHFKYMDIHVRCPKARGQKVKFAAYLSEEPME